MSDFMDSIFESIDTIVDKRLEDLAFDTTIICRITDDSKSNVGEYTVSDGNVIYLAYSEDQGYKSGESVRVAIPNSDFSRKKFIIGRYGDNDSSSPIAYVSPIDSVVNISGNLVTSQESVRADGIIMNNPMEHRQIIWNRKFTAKETEYLQNAGVYNTLLVKADFQTLMNNYKIIKGSYGLEIALLVQLKGLSTTEDVYISKSVTFPSTDFFGDPYNFILPSTQSKVFSMQNTEGIIRGIEVYLYQDNNFEDDYGKISYPTKNIEEGGVQKEVTIYPAISHIFVKNLEIGFGSNITGVADNVLQIYSPDSLEYKYHEHEPSTNQKRLKLLWYNKDEFDNYLGFSDGIFDPDYDELRYLELSRVNNRLAAQKGLEGIPEDKYGLHLAADLAELDSSIDKAAELITGDLMSELRALNEDIAALPYGYDENQDGVVLDKDFNQDGYIENVDANQDGEIKNIDANNDHKFENVDLNSDMKFENIDINENQKIDLDETEIEVEIEQEIRYRVNDNLDVLVRSELTPTIQSIKSNFISKKESYLLALNFVSKKKPYTVNIINKDDTWTDDDSVDSKEKTIKEFYKILDIMNKDKSESDQLSIDYFNENNMFTWETIKTYLFNDELNQTSVAEESTQEKDLIRIFTKYNNSIGFVKMFSDYLLDITKMLDDIQDKLTTFYAGYLGVYDIHKVRIKRILYKIDTVLKTFPTINIEKSFPLDFFVDGNPSGNRLNDVKVSLSYIDYLFYQNLKSIASNDEDYSLALYTLFREEALVPYQEASLDNYKNRYCIYWYKYNKGMHETTQYSEFLDENWEYCLTSKNIGCPQPYKNDEGNVILYKQLDITWTEEENPIPIKVVIGIDETEIEADIQVDEGRYYFETKDNDTEEFIKHWILFDNENKGYTELDRRILPSSNGETIYAESLEGVYYMESENNFKLISKYLPIFCEEDNNELSLYMNELQKEQRFKAVLFYNHEMYVSNELIFTNQDEIPNDAAIDKADGLYIEHRTDSFDTYMLYNESNYLQDNANEYTPREIMCHFNGLNLSEDDVLPGAGVYWYIPETSMITYDSTYLIDRGFVTDEELEEELKPAYSREGYICFYKQIEDKIKEPSQETPQSGEEVPETPQDGEEEAPKAPVEYDYTREEIAQDGTPWIYDTRSFWYQIRNFYEPSAGNNYIICRVIPKNSAVEYETKLYLTFGLMGNSGTNYTITVHNKTSKMSLSPKFDIEKKTCLNNGELTVKINLVDKDNNVLKTAEDIFSVDNAAVADQFSEGDTPVKVLNKAWIFRSNNAATVNNISGDEVTFSATTFEGTDKLESYKPASGILKLQVKNFNINQEATGPERKITLSHLQAIPWSREDYYMSGVSTIVYNSFGTLDTTSSLEIPYRLYRLKDRTEITTVKNGNGESVDLKWRVKGYLEESANNFVDIATIENNSTFVGALPKIEMKKKVITELVEVADPKADPSENKTIKVQKPLEVEIENYNMLVPSTMYQQGLGTQLFPVVQAYAPAADIDKEVVYWEQPLIIKQNQYQSPMLNEWDGEFTVDENNNYILSMMLGAGKKDSQNRFHGVIMGDLGITYQVNGVSGSTDPTTCVDIMTGLYGFHEGVQSFGFKADGTAFIGKAGNGRIEFDGNNGIIQSQGYLTAKTKTIDGIKIVEEAGKGMRINLADGEIDAYNFKLSSKAVFIESADENNLFRVKGQIRRIEITTYEVTYDKQVVEFDNKQVLEFYDTKVLIGEKDIADYKTEPTTGFVQITDANELKNLSPIWTISGYTHTQVRKKIVAMEDPNFYLMHVGVKNYYLQSNNYSELAYSSGMYGSLVKPEGQSEQMKIFTTTFHPGIKLDLAKGTLYVSQGVSGQAHTQGLTIDTTGINNANSLVLVAGQNFALNARGDLSLKGNWEIWTENPEPGKSAVCLSPLGVYHHYVMPTESKDWDLETWKEKLTGALAGTSDQLSSTSWEDISKLSIELSMIKVVLGLLAAAVVGSSILQAGAQILNFFGDLIDMVGSTITLAGIYADVEKLKAFHTGQI